MKKNAKEKKQKQFEVTLYYHTRITVEVVASSEKEAIEKAYSEVDKPKYNKEALANMYEDDSPDVEEVD